MHPLLIVAIPLVLIIIGLVLNSFGITFDHPASSPEQDPLKRMAAEREAYRKAMDVQRSRSLKRQQHVSQYGWLLLLATAGSFVWFYISTVNQTEKTTEIASVQTLGTEEGKGTVLSVTLKDGTNSKYLIRPGKTQKIVPTATADSSAEKVSSWELPELGTAVSSGGASLPVGISLEISDQKKL